jgi:hypothetical protein
MGLICHDVHFLMTTPTSFSPKVLEFDTRDIF